MNKTEKICVIEDNGPIRKLLCTVLKKSGYDTIDFGDGKSSLEWLKENLPKALIVDILLPDLNGSEILEYIRAIDGGSDVTIIAVTGFAKAGDRDKYLQMGFDSYIPKPINTATFAQQVQDVINEKNS